MYDTIEKNHEPGTFSKKFIGAVHITRDMQKKRSNSDHRAQNHAKSRIHIPPGFIVNRQSL